MDRLSAYDYHLPDELIAQKPLDDRAASRMLVLNRKLGSIEHRMFRDFPSLIEPGDLLVVNETRVTALRLYGRRRGADGRIELLVLNRTANDAYVCLSKPAKRLRVGTALEFDEGLTGVVQGVGNHGERIVHFHDPALLQSVGRTPLPPYIREQVAEPERYQTVYSRAGSDGGSAAAPTAGLHFTPEILAEVQRRGAAIATVSLEVGIDTFRPVQVEDLSAHQMHGERCTLPAATSEALIAAKGRIVAVGTTTARTLETFARLPAAYGRQLPPGTTTSTLFLKPGSEIRVVDALLTNFHLPRTTMLMMLSALADREQILHSYEQAVQAQYRFLSFGDAMFIV